MAWNRVQTFQQHADFNSSSHATTAVTLVSGAVAVGDTILLMTTVGVADITTLASTLTDQLGNTYNKLTAAQGGQLQDTVNAQGDDFWWCIVTNAGTPTITYTHNPPGASRQWTAIKGSHFTGSDAASTRHKSAGQVQTNPGTGTDAITSTAQTTTVNGCLVWGATGDPGVPTGTQVAGTSFTNGIVDAVDGFIDEWLSQSVAGSIAATFTDVTNGGTKKYLTAMIVITPATVASTLQLLGYSRPIAITPT